MQFQMMVSAAPAARFAVGLLPLSTHPIAEAMTHLLTHLDEPLDIDDLARRTHLSRRTFHRQFLQHTASTPLQWLITQRVLHAQHLLETTTLTVDDIARLVGFSTSVALRPHFRRLVGVAPQTYRATFSASSGSGSGTATREAITSADVR